MCVIRIVYCLLGTLLLSMTAFASDHAQDSVVSLEISAPVNGGLGEWRTKVVGTISQPSSEVWVVVRPLETRDFWVQPKPTVHANGEWETFIYLGSNGTAHIGKVFDLRAIANPVDSLEEGLVLPGWPRAESKSNIVRIARR